MITLDWIVLQDLQESVAYDAVNAIVQNEQIQTQISRFRQITGEEAETAISGEDKDYRNASNQLCDPQVGWDELQLIGCLSDRPTSRLLG